MEHGGDGNSLKNLCVSPRSLQCYLPTSSRSAKVFGPAIQPQRRDRRRERPKNKILCAYRVSAVPSGRLFGCGFATLCLCVSFRLFLLFTILSAPFVGRAEILWNDPGERTIHDSGLGEDLLHGGIKRDDTASDTLYFKFHLDPLSDVSTEEYYAGFQLFEGNTNRLAVGNAPAAWAYSAFYTAETGPSNTVTGDFDLHSSRPELAGAGSFKEYELPRRGNDRTIVFKVQYVPGDDDRVTVWLSPDLARGANADNQPTNLTTTFRANASFDQIHLRHVGGGNGWVFSDMAVATSFHDFVVPRFWQTWWFLTLAALGILAAVIASVRGVEQKKFQRQLQLAGQERALQRERARIAQDLHDELGSSLTRISLLCGLAKADAQQPGQVEAHVKKIAEASNDTVRALEEIVWAVRPGSDTLQSLVDYLAHFANELFDGQTTRCRLDLPETLPARTLPPDLRHNIFLVVKEALTNVLKHADAKEVRVQVKISGATLEITVQDDGRGVDSAKSPAPGSGQGLGNMQRRANALGGELSVENNPGSGTRVRLTVNLSTARTPPPPA
ncbi:MAG: sensor histidine kinase [Pedosphaera sp.]|nr:sensor histidine kinase [Pedosphaera sp.]